MTDVCELIQGLADPQNFIIYDDLFNYDAPHEAIAGSGTEFIISRSHSSITIVAKTRSSPRIVLIDMWVQNVESVTVRLYRTPSDLQPMFEVCRFLPLSPSNCHLLDAACMILKVLRAEYPLCTNSL